MKYNKLSKELITEIISVCGKENVILDKDKMVDYTHDEYPLKEIQSYPEIVVKPTTIEQISKLLRLANNNFIAVTVRGGGTGLCGGNVPVYGGIVLSLENMNKILEMDEQNFIVVSEAGVRLKDFFDFIENKGYFFPPKPGDESATIGGIISTNAGGSRIVKYGSVRNFVRGIEVVLSDGSVINLGGKFIKNSAGYSLLNLFIGSEGTLGVITKSIISVIPKPKYILTLVIPYENMNSAINSVPKILKNVTPTAIEFIEPELIILTEKHLNKTWPVKLGEAQIMIILDSNDEQEIFRQAETISCLCEEEGAIEVFVSDSFDKQKEILDIRSNFFEPIKPYTLEILDICVPVGNVGKFVNFIHDIEKEYDVWLPTFGHAGDGNVHTHYMKGKYIDGEIQLLDTKECLQKMDEIVEKIIKKGIELGGTITGEHGIGLVKKKYLSYMFTDRYISLLKSVKTAFDPNNILNPGKIFD